ncbi:hypothetical protein KFL_004920050 [Klebsormidium nitens]|uniref:Tudor domain-containing protein n=1 Tax=Klebsormidium nitens TaxID=105231 RepID=A0A1Y1IDW6_KLENI|nr:hypothetical protein KFL_004920050 [Klebsormidium nitens]|eukprot:GAQ89155.1 hypothetical protein KFL_004920050 [Klebsormidium nitens]
MQEPEPAEAPLRNEVVQNSGEVTGSIPLHPEAPIAQANVRRRRLAGEQAAAVEALGTSLGPEISLGGPVMAEGRLGDPSLGERVSDAAGQSVGQQESAPDEGEETGGVGGLQEGGEHDWDGVGGDGPIGGARRWGLISGARRGQRRSRKSGERGPVSDSLTSAGGPPDFAGAEGPVRQSKQGPPGVGQDVRGKNKSLAEIEKLPDDSAGQAEGSVFTEEKQCAECRTTKYSKRRRWPQGSPGREQEGGKRKPKRALFNEPERPRKKRHASAAEAEVYGVPLDSTLVNRRVEIWWPLDERYYAGRVTQFVSGNKRHEVLQILYDDGDLETVKFAKERWKLVEEEDKNESGEKSKVEEEGSQKTEYFRGEAEGEGEPNGQGRNNEVTALAQTVLGPGHAVASSKRIKVTPKRPRENGQTTAGTKKKKSRRGEGDRGGPPKSAGSAGGEAKLVTFTDGGGGDTLGPGPVGPPPAEHLEILRHIFEMTSEMERDGCSSGGTVGGQRPRSGKGAGERENGEVEAVARATEKRLGAAEREAAGGEAGPETLSSEELPSASLRVESVIESGKIRIPMCTGREITSRRRKCTSRPPIAPTAPDMKRPAQFFRVQRIFGSFLKK